MDQKPTTDDVIEEILRLRDVDRAEALEREANLARRIAALEARRWWHRPLLRRITCEVSP
jgi:hypothetical protein